MTPPAARCSADVWSALLEVPTPRGWPDTLCGVQADSRRIRPGDLFVAIQGHEGDGRTFVQDAVTRGASGVVIDSDADLSISVPVVKVPSARRALARLSRALFREPDKALHLTGVTGTNGKTSVTLFARQLLEGVGISTGALGTVGYSFGNREIPARRTTPAGPDLHETLDSVVKAGCSHCVMEVSSHALDQDRVFGLEFDTAVFTNLSQDHLDYHPDLDAYFEAKVQLFAMESVTTRIVGEDLWSDQLAERFGPEVIRCGLGAECQVRAEQVETGLTGTRAMVTTPWGSGQLSFPLPGVHNLRNVLQALAVAAVAGADFAQVLEAATTLKAPPGRLEPLASVQGPVFVDYAHTPDALAQVLGFVRELTSNRVVVVFGCGGDRDRRKRPLMVKAAGAYADVMLLTSDNPRTEDVDQIFADMQAGVEPGWTVDVVADRKQAIAKAVAMQEAGDVVVIAGKGHESVQEVGSVRVPFDDRNVAQQFLQERDQNVEPQSSNACA